MAIKQLSIICLLMQCITAVAQPNVPSKEDSMYFDGEKRYFRVFTPEVYREGQQLPLVFNFHATGANATSQEVISLMNPIANELGFFVCYPDALTAGFSLSADSGPDDIGFIDTLIHLLYEQYTIDTTRVFATGLSGGGFFSYELACNLSNRISKIAPVASALETSDCMPEHPVSIMAFHGTDDPIVRFSAAQNSINFWKTYYDCNADSTVIDFEDSSPNDGSTVQRITYQDCQQQIFFYTIIGGGHTWPGGAQVGTNFDISASREMALFLMDMQTTAPEVLLSSAVSSSTNAEQFEVLVEFSEIVTLLAEEAFDLVNASLEDLQVSNDSTYLLSVAPLAEGPVEIQVNEGVVFSDNGVGNDASNRLQIIFDQTQPSVVLSTEDGSITASASIPLTMSFSEPIASDPQAADFDVTNATLDAPESEDSQTYTMLLHPIASGEVAIQLRENVVEDLAGNGNETSNRLTLTYETVLGTGDRENHMLLVLPNPASEVLCFQLPASEELYMNVTLAALSGHVVKEETLLQRVDAWCELSVADVPSGIYLISATDSTGTVHHRKVIVE